MLEPTEKPAVASRLRYGRASFLLISTEFAGSAVVHWAGARALAQQEVLCASNRLIHVARASFSIGCTRVATQCRRSESRACAIIWLCEAGVSSDKELEHRICRSTCPDP